MADNLEYGWPSCPVTENGFLRVLGNATRAESFVRLGDLAERLKVFCNAGHHEFWPDSISLRDEAVFNAAELRGHQQLTDVYLLGLAVKRGARFVTFGQRVPLAAVRGATRASLEVIAAAE